KVTRTSWSLERATRTLLAEIDVPDPGGKLRPGMYAYATIMADRPTAWTLPGSAIATEGDITQGYRTYCYILEDGKARRTVLEIATRDGQRVEILKKHTRPSKAGEQASWQDISGNEEVIQGNMSSVQDGQLVKLNPAKP